MAHAVSAEGSFNPTVASPAELEARYALFAQSLHDPNVEPNPEEPHPTQALQDWAYTLLLRNSEGNVLSFLADTATQPSEIWAANSVPDEIWNDPTVRERLTPAAFLEHTNDPRLTNPAKVAQRTELVTRYNTTIAPVIHAGNMPRVLFDERGDQTVGNLARQHGRSIRYNTTVSGYFDPLPGSYIEGRVSASLRADEIDNSTFLPLYAASYQDGKVVYGSLRGTDQLCTLSRERASAIPDEHLGAMALTLYHAVNTGLNTDIGIDEVFYSRDKGLRILPSEAKDTRGARSTADRVASFAWLLTQNYRDFRGELGGEHGPAGRELEQRYLRVGKVMIEGVNTHDAYATSRELEHIAYKLEDDRRYSE